MGNIVVNLVFSAARYFLLHVAFQMDSIESTNSSDMMATSTHNVYTVIPEFPSGVLMEKQLFRVRTQHRSSVSFCYSNLANSSDAGICVCDAEWVIGSK